MTAEEAAAAKAEQVKEAEADGRRPTEDQPADIVPAPVAEDVTPPPAPVAEEAPAEEAPVPSEPTRPVNPRDAIAARIKAQRDAQNAGLEGDDPQHPPFLRPKPEEPAEPVAETPPVEQPKIKIKVNGEESEHSRDELVKLAGLDPEDADGLPEKSLIKAAQINEAARIKLEKSRTVPGAPPAPAAPAPIPAANNEPSAEPSNQKPARAIPAKVKEAVEKLSYGDPEEATAAFIDAIDAVNEERNTSARINELKGDNQRAIVQFSETNPDIAQDPRASRFLLTQITAEIIDDLRGLGAPEENLQGLLLNPNIAIEAHTQARLAGRTVRSPADIMNAAGNEVRSVFPKKSGAEVPPPPPAQTPAPQSRQEAKRALTQQPRAGNPVPPPAPTPSLNRHSDTVAKMRQMRGQGRAA